MYEGLYEDSPFSLFVSASGNENIYQWYRNRLPIDGADNENLVFSTLDQSNTASYYVVISNELNSVQSDPASLEVRESTVITSQPVDASAWAGEQVIFNASANGQPPLFYEWFHNDTSLGPAEENNSSLTINQVSELDLGSKTT